MASVDINNVVIVGRLTRDAETRYSQASNIAICSFSIAVNRSFSKERRDRDVSFFDVLIFGKTAEAIGKYLQKGKQIGIEGYLQQNRWEDQNGQKRSKVEIIANQVQFLSSGGQQQSGYDDNINIPSEYENVSSSNQSSGETDDRKRFNESEDSFPDGNEDIPF